MVGGGGCVVEQRGMPGRRHGVACAITVRAPPQSARCNTVRPVAYRLGAAVEMSFIGNDFRSSYLRRVVVLQALTAAEDRPESGRRAAAIRFAAFLVCLHHPRRSCGRADSHLQHRSHPAIWRAVRTRCGCHQALILENDGRGGDWSPSSTWENRFPCLTDRTLLNTAALMGVPGVE